MPDSIVKSIFCIFLLSAHLTTINLKKMKKKKTDTRVGGRDLYEF